MARRPKVTLRCIADAYADKSRERVIEFFDPVLKQGGLISFCRQGDGILRVDVYRLDPKGQVSGPGGSTDAR